MIVFPQVRIGDICKLINGKAFKPEDWSTSGVPIIRIQNLNDPSKPFNYWDGLLDRQVRIKPNDVLFAWSGTPGTSFGAHIWNGPAGILNQHIFLVELDDRVITKDWWVYTVNNQINELIDLAHGGVGLKHVTRRMIDDMLIPLPPLEEQKRIAAILDQADGLRRKRQRALDRVNQLGQAIFIEMFGDPTTNPMNWPVGIIRDLLEGAKYGTSAKANTDGVGIPVLRMGNLTYDGKIDLSDLKHVELSDDEFDKYTTRLGDILFNRTNSKELVGKTAVVTQDEPFAIAGYLVRARTNERGNPHYISAYMNSAHGKTTLRNMCKNIVGMANINAQEFQNIAIAVPPKELQDDFALRLDQIRTATEVRASGVRSSDKLFTSLQHRAFRGELTTSNLKEAAV